MPEATTTVAAPAAAPAASPAPAGNPSGRSGVVERITGPLKADLGDDFNTAPDPGKGTPSDGTSPVADQPVPDASGQTETTAKPDGTTDATAEKPAEVDPVESLLDYYAKLSPEEKAAAAAEAGPDANQQQPTGSTSKITEFLQAKSQEIATALKAIGATDAQIAELTNAPTLAGRHGAEIGQLRKDNQQFVKMAEMLNPVLEYDPQTRQPKGFNGVKLLEMATQQFGPEEVQRQLADIRLKIVPLDWQPSQPSSTGESAKAREAILGQVAKEFGISVEGLTAQEIRAEISANPDAADTYTERLADHVSKQNLQADVKVRLTEQQKREQQARQQQAQEHEDGQVLAMIEKLKTEIPHFAELEPIMADMYVKHFQAGQPSKVGITELLRFAAEGKTIGKRLPTLIAAVKKQARMAAFREMGIPESEVTDIAPSVQRGEKTLVPEGKLKFDSGFNERG